MSGASWGPPRGRRATAKPRPKPRSGACETCGQPVYSNPPSHLLHTCTFRIEVDDLYAPEPPEDQDSE